MAIVKDPVYKANLDRLKIDEINFDGIGYDLLETTNQMTYVKQNQTRTIDGSMTNLDDLDTYVLPSAKVGFKLLNLEDFYLLRALLLSKKTFNVTYYDVDFNDFVTHEMYVQPDDFKKVFSLGGNMVQGVLNFELTFVATLNEQTEYGLYVTDGSTTVEIGKTKWGRAVRFIGGAVADNTAYKYNSIGSANLQNTDNRTKFRFYKGNSITVFANTTLIVVQ